MLEQMKALAERLEGLSGADRETDGLIAIAFDIRPEWARKVHGRDPIVIAKRRYEASEPTLSLGEWGPSISYEAFTSSLDATVALVERTFPGEPWAVTRNGNGACEAAVPARSAEAPTAPLALLRALVAAKIAEAPIPSSTLGDNRT